MVLHFFMYFIVYLWRCTSQCVYVHIHALKYFKAEKGQQKFVFSTYHVWAEDWDLILMSPYIKLS